MVWFASRTDQQGRCHQRIESNRIDRYKPVSPKCFRDLRNPGVAAGPKRGLLFTASR